MRDPSLTNLAYYRARGAGDTPPCTLPNNIEAEQQFLGALLCNNEVLGRVAGFLKAEHFSEEIHRRIFMISASMIGEGHVASPVTLKTYLGEHDIEGATVPQYLARLAAEATTVINAPDYAREVRDLAARRQVMELARALENQAADPPVDMKPAALVSDAITRLQTIMEGAADPETRVRPAEAAMALISSAKAIKAGEKKRGGVPTGLPDLDMRTGGFQPGELWVIGGRPGQGKTVLGTGFARKVAEHGAHLLSDGGQGVGALLFSFELHRDQLAARILLKFVKATERYRGLRVYEIGEITGALKQLAKSEDVCIVLLVQAGRGVESRDRKDRRPNMADLRDSGDIEADADVVAFIYREAVYIKQSAEYVKGEAEALQAFHECEFKGEIIVSKTRSGAPGTTEIWIDASASTFASPARGGV